MELDGSCLIRTIVQPVSCLTGNPTTAPTGQLHLLLSDQTSAENHKVSAPAEGAFIAADLSAAAVWTSSHHVFVFVFRSC